MIELLRHLLYTGDIEEAQIQQYVHEHFTPQLEANIMTLAQRLEERGIQKGMQQGMLKGIQQGMLKGKLEGVQEGEQKGEHKKAIAFARRLIGKEFSLAEVAELTELPLHEVELLTVE